jgi:hypothetical protein
LPYTIQNRHPYNPLKALSHPFLGSPNGQVTLTRSSVLALSGWSNTQFSYWARRVEGVSVLSEHDERLKSVVTALERRLRGEVSADTDNAIINTTGKGLDIIIDEVKKRTGKSQFLRGKHSSLDPFGSVNPFDLNLSMMPENDFEADRCTEEMRTTAPPVYNSSFQAVAYLHEIPEGATGRMDGQAWQGERKQKKRKRIESTRDAAEDETQTVRHNTTPESSESQSGSTGSASASGSRKSSGAGIDIDAPADISLTVLDSRVGNILSAPRGREASTLSQPIRSSLEHCSAVAMIGPTNLPQAGLAEISSPTRKRKIR